MNLRVVERKSKVQAPMAVERKRKMKEEQEQVAVQALLLPSSFLLLASSFHVAAAKVGASSLRHSPGPHCG
jgi:hypothetical protein